MTSAEKSLNALEYIVHDMLALMLRANDHGFSPEEVLAAVEYILRQSHLALSEASAPVPMQKPRNRVRSDICAKMIH